MKKITVINHPLIQHKLTFLRDEKTNSKDFREFMNEISKLIAYEVLKDLKVKNFKIKTPMKPMTGKIISEKINLYPILRAGLGMLRSFQELVPTARVGHIGLYRDPETLKPVEYLFKYPNDTQKDTYNILIDPILATGNSAVAALEILKKANIKNIKFVGLLASKESIDLIHSKFPEVEIFVISNTEKLNKKGYLEPGLGDAGDRYFGTK